MNVLIISGSQREASQSLHVANYLKTQSLKQAFTRADVLDLHDLALPFWNEGFWSGSEEWNGWQPVTQTLQAADAVILITPEWHGMATPALKNFLLLCTDKELGHKPVLLTSVSASINGVYPISELRMTGSKNNHACFIPDHLIFRQSEALITQDLQCSDHHFAERCSYTLHQLNAYAQALKDVRRSLDGLSEKFPYGM